MVIFFEHADYLPKGGLHDGLWEDAFAWAVMPLHPRIDLPGKFAPLPELVQDVLGQLNWLTRGQNTLQPAL